MATGKYTANLVNRFWSRVEKKSPDECWEWLAGGAQGYGQIRYNGKHLYAHRISWELANGDIPDGLDILHSCDNPKCVNPNHLSPGTHLANMQDRNKKGRQAHVKGEHHGMHKLTDEQVKTIRDTYNSGGISQRELARRMNIGQSQVWRILKGESR